MWAQTPGCCAAWEISRRFERSAGQRVKHVAFAGLVDQIVKEGSELGVGEFDAGVRHDLNEPRKVGFDRQRRACAVENLKRAPFLLGGVFRAPLRGAVPYDLRETNYGSRLAADRRHLAGGPHPGPVLADAPSFLAAATTMGERVGHFTRELAEFPILLREEAVELLPQHLLFGPTEETLSAETPAGDEARSIDTDNGRVGRAIDDLA
jgi:hypothetical protein